MVGAAAGLAAPVIFHLLSILQTTAAPTYSQVAQPVSALSIQPLGWVQNLNFIIWGLLCIAFALGLRSGVRPRAGPGPWLHVVSGIGLVVLGVFPWRVVDGMPNEPIGHTIGSFLSFLGAAIGFIMISRPMAADARWRPLAPLSLTTGVVLLLLFFGFGAFAESKDAPLHAWMGLFQRVMGNVWFVCMFILALRLMRRARDLLPPPSP